MTRIIIDSRTSGGDLAGLFVRSLGLLQEAQITPRAGTKLLSKYAVIVTDDDATDRAVEVLRNASVSAMKEAA
jgi:hypothetical protein